MARRAPILLALVLAVSIGAAPRSGSGAARAAAKELPRVTFVAAPGASILVHGTYPKVESECRGSSQPVLHARYSGTIEVGKDTDGSLFVIGDIPFEDYLGGIAEVPRTWPAESLKAQVVAARSYALSRMGRPDGTGARLGYQLCATDACQVYRGLGISDGPYGDRWRQAVQLTRGEVLLHRGQPADTVYSSTSPGYTLGNDEVFGSAPLPYLRPILETDDGASPVSHWRATMPFDDLARFLRNAGHWGSEPIANVRQNGDDIVVKGGGATEILDVAHFRSHLNFWAPCLEPGRYPGTDSDGRLPQTIPSVWFHLTTEDGSMVLEGRGWGHAVGMVQWGAYGKANRGLSYARILAAYYGGLTPVAYDEPGRIRIGIATGLKSLTIAPSGSVDVLDRKLNPESAPWRITGGKRLTIEPGDEPPVWISPASLLRSPRSGRAGQLLHATVSVPGLSVVQLQLRVDGRDVPVGPRVTVAGGSVKLTASLPQVPSGTYQLRVVATNGIDRALSQPRPVSIQGVDPSPSPSASPPAPASVPPATPREEPAAAPPVPAAGRAPAVVVIPAVLVALFALLLLAVFVRRRRGKASASAAGGAG